MLILGEKLNGTNILHIIIGPETYMQFNMQGHSSLDISEYISNYQPGEKCMLVINRCDSEEEVIQMLEYQKSKMNIMNMMQQVSQKINEEGNNIQKTDYPLKNISDTKVKCPGCLKDNAATLHNGKIIPCETCRKIDEGLKKGVPPRPSNETLDELRKKIENENPEQRKSIFKFYKKSESNKNKKRGKNDTGHI